MPTLSVICNESNPNYIDFNEFSDLFPSDTKLLSSQEIDMHSLTPFQRVLLTIDGTVTKAIEAYSLEPINIVVLQQEKNLCLDDHSWLEISDETNVTVRSVLLQGSETQTIYAYASSLLVPNRFSKEINEMLNEEGSGIGKVLLSNDIESRRKILSYNLCDGSNIKHPDLIKEQFFCRTYQIIMDKKPIMLIHEKFPINQYI